MAIKRKTNDVEYVNFERELLSVLKNDYDHKIKFDGKLVFRSRRHDCLLAATDVHYDASVGDIVLVGAFKSGKPVMDETRGYPVMRTEVSVPLKECYEDLKQSSCDEERLISKAKKAVIDKYLNSIAARFESNGLFVDGIMKFEGLGVESFRAKNSDVVALSKDEDGRINIMCSNSFNSDFVLSSAQVSLLEIQSLGRQLDRVGMEIVKAKNTFANTMARLEPKSMSYSPLEQKSHYAQAAVAVFEAGYPIRIVDCIAKNMAKIDVFDPERHTAKEIAGAVERFKKDGTFRKEENKGMRI